MLMAASKRLAQLGVTSTTSLTNKLPRLSIHFGGGSVVSPPNSGINRFDCRHITHSPLADGKRLFLVDNLAMVRSLEAKSLSSKQAKAITSTIVELLDEHVAHSFDSKAEKQKTEIGQESNFPKVKSEEQSSNLESEEDHFIYLKGVIEEVRSSLEKMRGQLRDEADKRIAIIHSDIGELKAAVKALKSEVKRSDKTPKHPPHWPINDWGFTKVPKKNTHLRTLPLEQVQQQLAKIVSN